MPLADVPNRNGIVVTVSGGTTVDHGGTTVDNENTKKGHFINKRITEVMENGTSEPSSLQSSRCEIYSVTHIYIPILYLCFMVCMCVSLPQRD